MVNGTGDIVLVDVADGIAVVTLNRPERRNALNRALYQRIPQVVTALDADDAVAVIVLTGADPAFCAGVDLKELGDAPASGAGGDDANSGRTPWRGNFPPVETPVIGAINGACVTGGLELALCCDFLVASERARFADTHARVGILPGDGLTVRLPMAVGIRRAKEMSVTGNFVDAATALEWGLVNHVVPHDELLPFARRLAADIASIDGRAVRKMLDTYDVLGRADEDTAWEHELRVSVEWQQGWDRADLAARRDGIIERGRGQAGAVSAPTEGSS
jgi:enoyl-CoA hydratase/carnithine racemase